MKKPLPPPPATGPDPEVQWVPVDVPLPWDRNPRKITDDAVKAVCASIERFGQTKPILLRRADRMLIAGHTTLRALQHLHRKQVLVRWLNITRHDAEALCVADNRTGEFSEWDEDKLGPLLDEIRKAEASAIAAVGYSEREIDKMLEKLDIQRRLRTDEDLDGQLEPPKNPESKPGAIYELGPHRLMCGDSESADDVRALLHGRVPILHFTDPPYGVEYEPDWRSKDLADGGKRKSGKVQGDHRDDWRTAYQLYPAPVLYVFHAAQRADVCKAGIEAADYDVRNQIIWRKPHFALSRGDYHWQHEPCWYAVKRGATSGWIGDRKQTTVWEADSGIGKKSGGGADAKTPHGTQKPVALAERAITNHVPPGELVVDGFAGSGSTLIAADRIKRVCFAMEKDPAYCDVIRDRWRRWQLKIASEGGDP